MLDLLHSYVGCPAAGLQHLVLPQNTLIAYPSADVVVVLYAHNLSLARILAFEEAFPGIQKNNIPCVAVDTGMKLIVASMGTHVAAWSLSGVNGDIWRVHSSMILSNHHVVTALDCKSGLLCVGTSSGLSIYTLILENDLPTWSQKWTFQATTPSMARFSPSLMYFATISQNDNFVRIYSTTSGRLTQEIPHPRSVSNITWRDSSASSRDDLILYTITLDSVLRIFLPVLDSPQRLQLHASLDLFSSLPFNTASEISRFSPSSAIFWLDRELIVDSLEKSLKQNSGHEDSRSRRVRDVMEEGWDIFLRVLGNGSVVLTAVSNIDCRPPTLLKQFLLRQTLPNTLPFVPSFLYLLPSQKDCSLTLVTAPPLATYKLNFPSFLDARLDGLSLRTRGPDKKSDEEKKITRFIRTPEGNGVGVIRSEGGQAWQTVPGGSELTSTGSWSSADLVVILQKGSSYVTYCASESALTLSTTPDTSLNIPNIVSLFSIPSRDNSESIIGVTSNHLVVHVIAFHTSPPTLTLHSHNPLPLDQPPKMILAVDPMAWNECTRDEHDVLLSVSEQGELAFWAFEEHNASGWRCTGRIRTGRSGFSMARCSSAKKSALVNANSEGEELTIWDSTESEFASGLEYHRIFSSLEPINDLDWSSTPDNQSILAVGFAHRVELLCQQRMTYFDEGPGWAICWTISIGHIIPHPISDSIWLANGSFLIGAGHQMFLFGQPKDSSESLFEHVARLNGPLPDYHPQMLLQCLLWEKIDLVKEIIVNLAHGIQDRNEEIAWVSVPVAHFLRKSHIPISNTPMSNGRYKLLFDQQQQNDGTDEGESFSRALVHRLIKQLEASPLPHLTPNEHAHLLVLVQTTLEIDEQRRALDANGLRYLISMRSFYILNRRASAPSSPRSNGAIPMQTGKRERLRYRDMIWAFHSESQELLLASSIAACDGKICWSDAKALGIFIWLNSLDSLKSCMESIARNEYMSDDLRDPIACALFYFALGKNKLVHGLWRQAAWHKEQAAMLKFLSNDFTEPRWRTAALKNAYALLGKRRFEYAAAFFLLGGSLKDAVNVCIKQLGDFQLAIALARIAEQGSHGPILREIVINTVLPIVFRDGNRWLGSWAFWLLHRRDLAVRILLTPLQDMAAAFDVRVTDIGQPHYDDPSLALLFSQLRSKSLQTAKGTSEISGMSEFNFVLQMARVFCRMGCHVLALDLVQSWSFERPSALVRVAPESPVARHERLSPPSPTIPRRSMLGLEPSRRRSSMVIDMDILSGTPTRSVSPERKTDHPRNTNKTIKEESDLFARKAGLGSLLKSARQDVKVEEFDINAFSF